MYRGEIYAGGTYLGSVSGRSLRQIRNRADALCRGNTDSDLTINLTRFWANGKLRSCLVLNWRQEPGSAKGGWI